MSLPPVGILGVTKLNSLIIMKNIIRNHSESMGYDISDYDIEQILTDYFHLLSKNGDIWIQGIRSAIRAYFSED